MEVKRNKRKPFKIENEKCSGVERKYKFKNRRSRSLSRRIREENHGPKETK